MFPRKEKKLVFSEKTKKEFSHKKMNMDKEIISEDKFIMENLNNGYLEVILGPMFSGKTSKLLEIQKQYAFCNISVLTINQSDDNRYGTSNKLITHDERNIDCISATTIKEVLLDNIELLTSPSPLAVLINEGQFFEDLYECVFKLVTIYKKHVYVAGLDGDSNRSKFGEMLEIIPLCDNVTKLHSLCVFCKSGIKGIFSHRLKHSNCQKQIGSNDLYVPLCRKCFDNQTINTLVTSSPYS